MTNVGGILQYLDTLPKVCQHFSDISTTCTTMLSLQQKGQYTILNGFFVNIPIKYQFPHVPVWKPEFSILVKFMTFTYHLYTSSHIPTTNKYFSLIPSCIPICENFLFFCFGQTFSWRYWSCFLHTSADIPSKWSLIHWIYVNGSTMWIIHVKSHGHP